LKKNLIIIGGPTAAGKTDLSIRLAKYFSTEIISADSRQFYWELNIGTAKPSFEQQLELKHHFINSLSIEQDYNAGKFEEDCITLLEKLFIKYNNLIMVGGSGLYINSIINGIDQLPNADTEIRKSLIEKFKNGGIESLQNQLNQLDEVYYEKVDLQNPQRLMRAIEVCLVTGKKYSSLIGKKKVKRNFNSILIGLQTEKNVLHDRINKRVDKMIADGLEEEVKNLLPYKNYNALQTVGYKELIDYFDKKISLEEAIELIKQNTRHYAKRQMTWFKKMNGIEWFESGEWERIINFLKQKVES
jgi:tRNA dimethylallyltransferase